MDPQFITPFIKSIQNVFSTMMQLQVNVGDRASRPNPSRLRRLRHHRDERRRRRLHRPVVHDRHRDVPRRPSRVKTRAGHPDFADAVGELVNMVSGNARASSRQQARQHLLPHRRRRQEPPGRAGRTSLW